MHTIFGAGSVGLSLGARLARSGLPVLFVTRSEAGAHCITRQGVHVEDPVIDERWAVKARAVANVAAARDAVGRGPVFLCVRAPDTEAAARVLAAAAPGASVVSVQNGVDNEERLARHFGPVIGAVWRQTCTRHAPNAVRVGGRPRMVIGAWPRGAGAEVEALAGTLRSADIDVGISERIQEDLWLKLCVNLTSAPNALVRRPDHVTRAFVELKARLLEEARAALAAAGMVARSCDGRDRSLDEEIRYHRGSLVQGTSARALPLYNPVWTGLRHGAALESDAFHRRILELAREHGLEARLNARVLAALEAARRRETGPECLGATELLGEEPGA